MVDVVLPVLMQRQAIAVRVSLQWRCHRFSSLTSWGSVWACGCALTVVDLPVVRQKQVPTAFRVPLRVWKRSLLRAASRYSHLDPRHCSCVLLVTGWHSAQVFSRQSMVTSGRISGNFYVVSAHEQSAHENLDVTSTSLSLAGFPRNARLNSGYMFLFCFWRHLDVFPTFSTCWCTRILRSILALLSVVLSLVIQSTV